MPDYYIPSARKKLMTSLEWPMKWSHGVFLYIYIYMTSRMKSWRVSIYIQCVFIYIYIYIWPLEWSHDVFLYIFSACLYIYIYIYIWPLEWSHGVFLWSHPCHSIAHINHNTNVIVIIWVSQCTVIINSCYPFMTWINFFHQFSRYSLR